MSEQSEIQDLRQQFGLDEHFLRQKVLTLEQALMSNDISAKERVTLQKEHARLAELADAVIDYGRAVQQVQRIKSELVEYIDSDFKDMLELELQDAYDEYEIQYGKLQHLLFPPDEEDERSVFLEVRAGTGGQEAALFASDLARMYTLYAQQVGWRVSVASSSQTDLGGYREIILHIEGKGVYGSLKRESGVHRVQRVPATETQGRVHTSTATVAVLPEVEEVDSTINMADIRIDVYRASGAGGQHVNTTDSAVRLTHIPTGLVVACQDERSQHKNKNKALKILQARLQELHRREQQGRESAQRKELIGSGERAEKVRTYNFPQNRITDHQIGLTLNKLDRVMEGDLSELIQALIQDDIRNRQQAGFRGIIS